MAARVAIKYDIGLKSSMFTSADHLGYWKSGRERQWSVRLAIQRPGVLHPIARQDFYAWVKALYLSRQARDNPLGADG
jgi:hypothetical protein